MTLVPVHDPQLAIEVSSNNGQWSDHGDNRYGPELRSRGGGNYVTHFAQRSIVIGNVSAVMGTVEALNTGVTPKDGYHGLGLHISALKLVGDDLREIWNNSLLTAGNIDHWLTDLTDVWSRGSIVVQFPENIAPDYIDATWVYKTSDSTGKIRIDKIAIREHYSRVFRKSIVNNLMTNFTLQYFPRLFGTRDANLRARFVTNHVARIAKGQEVEGRIVANTGEVYAQYQEVGKIGAQLVPALKLLSKDGTSDWVFLPFVVGNDGLGNPPLSEVNHTGNRNFIARNNYFQVEWYFMILPQVARFSNNTRTGSGVDIKDLELTVIIKDNVETGNT